MKPAAWPAAPVAALAGLLALAACIGPEAGRDAPAAGQTPVCRVDRVIDGDTVDLSCAAYPAMRARLTGFDTPEVTDPACPAELAAGREATRVLRTILAEGPVTDAIYQGDDRYGRALVRLEVAGADLAARMIGAGVALPYQGGRRPDWCARLAAG